jgi:hypothetical protein
MIPYATVSRISAIPLILVCLAWIEVGSSASPSKYANYGEIFRGVYLMAVPGETSVSFRTYDDVDLEQCARECALRTKCLSFNYERKNQTCELNDVTVSNTTSTRLVARIGFLYSEKKTWPHVSIVLTLHAHSHTISHSRANTLAHIHIHGQTRNLTIRGSCHELINFVDILGQLFADTYA